MKTRFSKSAELPLDLKLGSQVQTLTLAGPPLGWDSQLEAAFTKPLGLIETRVGKGQIQHPPTEAQLDAWRRQKLLLCVGKVLAVSGELEAVYPDPLPTDRAKLVTLAKQVEDELAEAGLIDGHLLQLQQAYYRLTLGSMFDEARAAGNASARAEAP